MDYVYFTNAGNKCGRKRTFNFAKGHPAKQRKVGVDLRCPIYRLEEKKQKTPPPTTKNQKLDYSHLWSLQHLGTKKTEMRTVGEK